MMPQHDTSAIKFGNYMALMTTTSPQEHFARFYKATGDFYELDVLLKCRELYFPDTIIMDVGANIGNHTIFFAGVLNARVIAVEPNRPVFDILEQNIARNGQSSSVQAIWGAAGATEGTGSVIVDTPSNAGVARFVKNEGDVPLFRIDSLNVDVPVSIIKVDVEGMEHDVLIGAEVLLRKWRPFVFAEAHDRSSLVKLGSFLSTLGYELRGRYATTPTYLFGSTDEQARQRVLWG